MRQGYVSGLFTLLAILICACGGHHRDAQLEASFQHPPDSVKPWVFWFWMNGNVSREGITSDLESLKNAGINGVLWMEVSGPWWAPDGPVEPGSSEWMEMMQWAIAEADRLGMSFDLSVDFGYGSGGPHITPDISMQQLVSSQVRMAGGKAVNMDLPKPVIDYMPAVRSTWLRARNFRNGSCKVWKKLIPTGMWQFLPYPHPVLSPHPFTTSGFLTDGAGEPIRGPSMRKK